MPFADTSGRRLRDELRELVQERVIDVQALTQSMRASRSVNTTRGSPASARRSADVTFLRCSPSLHET